jgi:hypothetical protein
MVDRELTITACSRRAASIAAEHQQPMQRMTRLHARKRCGFVIAAVHVRATIQKLASMWRFHGWVELFTFSIKVLLRHCVPEGSSCMRAFGAQRFQAQQALLCAATAARCPV